MRKWASTLLILLTVIVAGCDKPIITIDLKGQPSIPAQPAPPRFQLVMHPEFPGQFTYLLDTQTGALWNHKKVTDVEGKPTVWVQETFQKPTVSNSALSPISDEIFNILHPLIKEEEVKK